MEDASKPSLARNEAVSMTPNTVSVPFLMVSSAKWTWATYAASKAFRATSLLINFPNWWSSLLQTVQSSSSVMDVLEAKPTHCEASTAAI